MLTRRTFLGSALLAPALAAADPAPARKKLAIITNIWFPGSHAWHMGERFMVGYPLNGKWHTPPFEVVSAYVDQTPANDLSKKRAAEFGFKIYPTVAEALRNGTDKLAVDAVLVIGEHGEYPLSEFGQTKYPRYEFFTAAADVMEKDGRVVPLFSDKHLSWKWEWAKEMVDRSKKLKMPFLAGSSLPQTWRMPSVDLPWGAEVEEVLGLAYSRPDHYDIHALEMMQCMAERRKGGETGVVAVQGVQGEEVWKAMAAGSWAAGGWDPALFDACVSRSQSLAQPDGFSHRRPSVEKMRAMVKDPVMYRIEYADGLKATMLLMTGLVGDFNFAAKLKGEAEPLSTLFHLPPRPNVEYSAHLMAKAEEMFTTGKPPYPIERNLLTTGLVEAGCRSLGTGQKRLETPHLAIKYTGPKESQFARE